MRGSRSRGWGRGDIPNNSGGSSRRRGGRVIVILRMDHIFSFLKRWEWFFCGFFTDTSEDFASGRAWRQLRATWPSSLYKEQVGGTQGYDSWTSTTSPLWRTNSTTSGKGLVRSTTTLTCERVRLTKFLVKSSVSFGSPTRLATKLRPCWWRRSSGTPVKCAQIWMDSRDGGEADAEEDHWTALNMDSPTYQTVFSSIFCLK